jgi:hypothetical protein
MREEIDTGQLKKEIAEEKEKEKKKKNLAKRGETDAKKEEKK